MIVAACVVPAAPLLLPGLAGAQDPVPHLRAAIAAEVARLVASGVEEVLVLAEAVPGGEHEVTARLGLHRWGVGAGTAGRPDGEPSQVPLPFAVASVLLGAAGHTGRRRWVAVPAGTDAREAAAAGAALARAGGGRTGLLVLAEGSARRTEKAPGHLHPRATAFDDALLDAVRTDLGGVLALDPALAAELWVHGLAAWQALAGALVGTDQPARGLDVRWSGDPFGVLYVVAGTRHDAAGR